MKLIYSTLIAAVMTVALIFGIYFFDRMHNIHRDVDQVVLYLQWFDQAQFAGFYAADANGIYDKYDLKVRIVPRPRDASDWNVPQLISKQTGNEKAFGIWPGDQFLRQASNDNFQLRAVGAVFDKSLACFMVRDETGPNAIFGPNDFSGKKIGVFKDFDTEIIINWILHKYPPPGVAPTIISLTPADADKFLSKLQSGDVDVWPSYAITEPILAKPLQTRLVTPSSINLHYYSDTVITSAATLEQHRDVVERFLEASEEGWRWALEHPHAAAISVVARDSKHLNLSQQEQMIAEIANYVNPTNPFFQMKEETWKSTNDVLLEEQKVTQSFKSQLVDLAVAGDAHKKYHREALASR